MVQIPNLFKFENMFKFKISSNSKYVQTQNMFKFKNLSNLKTIQTFKTAPIENKFEFEFVQTKICSKFDFFLNFLSRNEKEKQSKKKENNK
jgi:hypothetical protein